MNLERFFTGWKPKENWRFTDPLIVDRVEAENTWLNEREIEKLDKNNDFCNFIANIEVDEKSWNVNLESNWWLLTDLIFLLSWWRWIEWLWLSLSFYTEPTDWKMWTYIIVTKDNLWQLENRTKLNFSNEAHTKKIRLLSNYARWLVKLRTKNQKLH